jgi:hypothetical protein
MFLCVLLAETVGATALAGYSYDLANRMLTAGNADALMTRTYDTAGRLFTERQQHLFNNAVVFDTTVSRGYEPSGMLSNVTDAIGTTDYLYNERGLLKDVNVDGAPPAFSFLYDNVGRRQTGTNEIGVTETRNYDDAGQFLSVYYKDGANVVKSSSAYDLNGVGLRTGLTRNGTVGGAYGYDNNRQVTGALANGAPGAVLPVVAPYNTPDHPYFVKGKGWASVDPTETMER